MWTETRDLYLHDTMHCTAAAGLADWVTAWMFLLKWTVSVQLINANIVSKSLKMHIKIALKKKQMGDHCFQKDKEGA